MSESHQISKTLVEDAITLKTSHFGKNLFYVEYGQNDHCGAKNGCFYVGIGERRVTVYYDYNPLMCLEQMDLQIAYPNGRVIYQEIHLDWAQLNYGLRPYFTCSCGRRCDRLYIAQHSHFYCRHCQMLTYELTRVKKTTLRGLAYPLLLSIKTEERKSAIKRVVYGGKMTNKATALIKLAQKANGLVSQLRLAGMHSQKI